VSEKLAISFVLPVLNETDSLRATADTIFRVGREHLHEVLVVLAERSREASLEVAEQLQREHPESVRIHRQRLPRLGGALREGFELAAGTHVMLMASDLETDPEMIPRFIEKMQQGGCDVVAASRWIAGGGFHDHGSHEYGPMKYLLNWTFQGIFRRLFGTRLTDLTYGYRLYRREVLRGIRWEELGYPFLLECLLKPLRLGASVDEVPCSWHGRTAGQSANSFWQMCQYAPVALRIRLIPRERIRCRAQRAG